MIETSPDHAIRISRMRKLCANGGARQLRKDARLSMQEVADALGCTTAAVSSWEIGFRSPRGLLGRRYAELLERLAEELATDTT